MAEKVAMAARSGVLDVDPVMERMSGSMYAVNRYSAFSYLRVCQIIMGFKMTGATEAAGLTAACRMTKFVGPYFDVLPYSAFTRALAAAGVREAHQLTEGDVALNYCEAAKALVKLGIVPAKCEAADLAAALTSDASKLLLGMMPKLSPLPWADAVSAPSVRFQEREQVDRYLPLDRRDKGARWERGPHVCKGAASL